jgi:hypothetical protein
MLRPYVNCPGYISRLSAWYQSEEFTSKEREHRGFITEVETVARADKWYTDDKPLELKNFWNFFDLWSVGKVEFPASLPAGLSKYSSQIQSLANWLESRRYGYDIATSLVAANHINFILDKMITAAKANGAVRALDPEFYYYSGHYPNQLSLFAALMVDKDYPDLMLIPEYASLLMIELHSVSVDQSNSASGPFVKVVFKNGVDGQPMDLTLTSLLATYGAQGSSVADGPFVPLSLFTVALQNRLKSDKASNAKEWCETCGNKVADVCLKRQLDILGPMMAAVNLEQQNTASSISMAGAISITFIVAFLAGLVLMPLVAKGKLLIARHSRVMKYEIKSSEAELDRSSRAVINI